MISHFAISVRMVSATYNIIFVFCMSCRMFSFLFRLYLFFKSLIYSKHIIFLLLLDSLLVGELGAALWLHELKLNDKDHCKLISLKRFIGQEFGTELEG